MFGDLKEIISQLNSKSDWAVVGTAGIVGFVVDAAIDIIPIPIFSPGVCGVTAAGTALSAKRGWEATIQSRRDKAAMDDYRWEANRIAGLLEENNDIPTAEWLKFQIQVAKQKGDPSILQSAIEKAIEKL
jgi:hypothetical protein